MRHVFHEIPTEIFENVEKEALYFLLSGIMSFNGKYIMHTLLATVRKEKNSSYLSLSLFIEWTCIFFSFLWQSMLGFSLLQTE